MIYKVRLISLDGLTRDMEMPNLSRMIYTPLLRPIKIIDGESWLRPSIRQRKYELVGMLDGVAEYREQWTD